MGVIGDSIATSPDLWSTYDGGSTLVGFDQWRYSQNFDNTPLPQQYLEYLLNKNDPEKIHGKGDIYIVSNFSPGITAVEYVFGTLANQYEPIQLLRANGYFPIDHPQFKSVVVYENNNGEPTHFGVIDWVGPTRNHAYVRSIWRQGFPIFSHPIDSLPASLWDTEQRWHCYVRNHYN